MLFVAVLFADKWCSNSGNFVFRRPVNMSATELLTLDEAIDNAYDIFLELASDNLAPEDMLILGGNFEDTGAADVVEVADDWVEHVGFGVDKDTYAEVLIGLVNEDDELDQIYARLLISREKDNKFCHILWKKAD